MVLFLFDDWFVRFSWNVSVYVLNYVVRLLYIFVYVVVLGFGCDFFFVKYFVWVSVCEVLEKVKFVGVIEIVLFNDGDGFLEGLVMNFFVVVMNFDLEV